MDLTNRLRQSAAWPASRAGISLSRHSRGRSKPGSAEAGTKLVRACSCGGGSAAGRDLVTNVARLLDTLEGREAQAWRRCDPARTGAGSSVCRSGPFPTSPWRKMPKRVRPYGSAEDAEDISPDFIVPRDPRQDGERLRCVQVGRDRFVEPLQVAAPGALEPRRRFLVGEGVVGVPCDALA